MAEKKLGNITKLTFLYDRVPFLLYLVMINFLRNQASSFLEFVLTSFHACELIFLLYFARKFLRNTGLIKLM
jgi:hypothetical protein